MADYAAGEQIGIFLDNLCIDIYEYVHSYIYMHMNM